MLISSIVLPQFIDGNRWRQLILLLLSCSYLHLVQAQTLIINPSVSLSCVDRNTARLLFTMRIQQWPNQADIPVRVFVLADDNPVHREFTKTILGIFPYQLRHVWDRQLFSGTGQVPITLPNEQEMITSIAKTPGAIGYVSILPKNVNVHTLCLE